MKRFFETQPLALLLTLAWLAAPTSAQISRPHEASAGAIDMLPGVMQAQQAVELAPQLAGVIREVFVGEMQSVEQGAVLVALDDRLAQASLAAAEAVCAREAALQQASLNVSLAEKYLARVRDAHQRNAASDLELDEASGRLDEARAGLARAHEQQREAAAQAELERVRLEGHQLKAPFAGHVMRITARPGETASPNEPVLRLANLSQLRATLHVPARYFGKLRVGQSYTLVAELPGVRHVEAKLIAREPIIDAATETYRCVFEIDNSRLSLPAGFAVRLHGPALSGSATQESSR